MRIGAIFPHFEFGNDPTAVSVYARTAESLGLAHIGADDHVIGPNPVRPGGYNGWTSYRTAFHEPFVLFGFMAAVTTRIELATAILILPQRQTVLAAKQAAALDVLSGGRLRLGIGNGWNEIEYQSLGMEFTNRARRIEEQIDLMRRLWTQELVDFKGKFHHVPDAGLNPLPVQRPIPIWFGGQSEPVIRRAARLGDGWMPTYADAQEAASGLELFNASLREAGRSRAEVGLEGRIPYASGDPGRWRELYAGWRDAGASHISLVATDSGLQGAEEHIRALQKFANEVQRL
jgi:probable F420-dependent oxidoreductase